MQFLQPPGWATPKGYANGVAARGILVFVGGQIGWNGVQQFESDHFIAQTKQALQNVYDVLACSGAGPEHMVRMTWYITDLRLPRGHGKVLPGHDLRGGLPPGGSAREGGDRGHGGAAGLKPIHREPATKKPAEGNFGGLF